ncbi:MAG: class B sortase, partial [Oscillospiraceae bacterium]
MAMLNETPQHYKKKKKSEVVFARSTALITTVSLVCSVLLIATSCKKTEKEPEELVTIPYTTKVETIVTTTEEPEPVLVLTPEAEARLAKNKDSAGWVKIDGVVDEEYVQRTDAETGNIFYLDHDLTGAKKDGGTIFADYRNVLNGRKSSDNIILYGHNQKNGSRFGQLDLYRWNTKYVKSAPIIELSTNYGTRKYKIFATFLTNVLPEHDNGTVFDYQNYLDLSDEARYNDFVENVMKRSTILTGIDLKYGDKFVTLS